MQDTQGREIELRYFRDIDLVSKDDIRVCSAHIFLSEFV